MKAENDTKKVGANLHVVKSKKEIGAQIADNIRFLASKIARKPTEYAHDWARIPEESLFLYTNTRTVNLILSFSEVLTMQGWPFPSFMSIEQVIFAHKKNKMAWIRQLFLLKDIFISSVWANKKLKVLSDRLMIKYFRQNSDTTFSRWKSCPFLSEKSHLIDEIAITYKKQLWTSCISTTFPLLDFVMRHYLGTKNLNAGIQCLSDAFFRIANLKANDLKPGYAIWNAQNDSENGNTIATSLQEDLRLPGIYLASFFEFAKSFYAWYSSTTDSPPTTLNRHAVIHCAADYCTEVNTTKLLSFFDLTLHLEPFFRIIIHGESGDDQIMKNFGNTES